MTGKIWIDNRYNVREDSDLYIFRSRYNIIHSSNVRNFGVCYSDIYYIRSGLGVSNAEITIRHKHICFLDLLKLKTF